jgi:hypothetical protein
MNLYPIHKHQVKIGIRFEIPIIHPSIFMTNKLLLTVIVAIFIGIVGSSFAQKNTYFKNGEELSFKVTYGFLDAAEAKMIIHPQVMTMNEQPAFKIDIIGKTLGVFKLFKVNDNWGSYLDTTKLIPYLSYRHIEEGRYRKNEKIYFDHHLKSAQVKLYDRENKKLIDSSNHLIPNNIQDIVSGFYYLRTLDLKKNKPGDMITINGFFDKTIYNLKLVYEGKEQIDTPLGKYETLIFTPIMPSNKLFRGKYPIKVWVSDDKNRIPLKIKARLMVGSLDMDIIDAKGLRN